MTAATTIVRQPALASSPQPPGIATPQRISVKSRIFKAGPAYVSYMEHNSFDWLAIVLLPGEVYVSTSTNPPTPFIAPGGPVQLTWTATGTATGGRLFDGHRDCGRWDRMAVREDHDPDLLGGEVDSQLNLAFRRLRVHERP